MVKQDYRESKVKLGQLDNREYKEKLGIPERLELKGFKDCKAKPERKVKLEQLETTALLVQQAHKDQLGLQAQQGLTEHTD